MNENTSTQFGKIDPQFQQAMHHHADEDEIKTFLNDFTAAIRKGNLEELMSFYGKDLVAYDMMPPLRFLSVDRYQEAWRKYFTETFVFPVHFSYREQRIVVMGNYAFSYGIVEMSGNFKNGEHVHNWLRNTTCMAKLNGKWKIIHEHNSVPTDESGKAMMDLSPQERGESSQPLS